MQNGLLTNEATNDIFETQPTINQQVTTYKESNKEINKENHSYKKNGIRSKALYGIQEDQAWTAEEKLAALREGWKQ